MRFRHASAFVAARASGISMVLAIGRASRRRAPAARTRCRARRVSEPPGWTTGFDVIAMCAEQVRGAMLDLVALHPVDVAADRC